MRDRWRHTRFGAWSFTVVTAMVAVMVLRALVPAGYMLAPPTADRGPFALTICTANAALKTVDPAAPSPGKPSEHKSSDHKQLCAFAVAQGGTLPPQIVAIFFPQPVAVPADTPRAFALRPVRVGPHLGARAPPAQA